MDLSGIGWLAATPNQSITLVSPQYFVGATHLFPEPGALERVIELAGDWFVTHLKPTRAKD